MRGGFSIQNVKMLAFQIMNQQLEIINPLTFQGWDDLVLTSETCSFFHSSSWARVLHEAYQYQPLYFTIINNNKIQVLIPCMEVNSFLTGKRGVSLPFSDYSDSIISESYNTEEIFKYLIHYGKENGWKTLEIRGGNVSSSNLHPSSSYYGHTLSLSKDADKIFSTFRDSTKRNIKKAIKEGVTVGRQQSLEAIKEFYSLNCMTRKEHGLPPQPFSFFKNIYEHIISQNKGFVVLASFKDINIAGAVFFHFGNKAIYKYGASDKNHQYLRANNLVMWEAIKWFAQHGFSSFCFGRTEPENQGLLQFKRGWGGQEDIIKYIKYDLIKGEHVKDSPKITGLHNKMFNKMPMPLLRGVGTVLYKHMG